MIKLKLVIIFLKIKIELALALDIIVFGLRDLLSIYKYLSMFDTRI